MSRLVVCLSRRPLVWSSCVSVLALTASAVWLILTLPGRIDARLQENAVAASADLRNATHHLAAASEDLEKIASGLADPRTGIARTLRNVNTVAAQVGRASNVARLASSEQRAYLQQISRETAAAVDSANLLISGANQNLNQGTLPALTAGLQEARDSLAALAVDGHQAIGAATATLNAAGAVLGDPLIPATTKTLASAGAHLDGTAANIEQATGYLKNMLKPAKGSFWKSLALGFLPKLFLHFLPQRTTVVNEPTVKTEPK